MSNQGQYIAGYDVVNVWRYPIRHRVTTASALEYEPRHEISNNVVCATSKASDQPAHTRSLIGAFASLFLYSKIVELLTEHHLGFLGLRGGCTGSSESTLVKMPHCRKFHAIAHIVLFSRFVKPVFGGRRYVCMGQPDRCWYVSHMHEHLVYTPIS